MKYLALFACLVFVSCQSNILDNSDCPEFPPAVDKITLSGHIKYNYPVTLPSDLILICYSNFGEPSLNPGRSIGMGTIDPVKNTFTITITHPPEEMSSIEQITADGQCHKMLLGGFGYIVLPQYNDPPSSDTSRRIYGAINNTALVYCRRNFTPKSWLANFPQGFGLGQSPDSSGSLHLIPTTNLELLIDTSEAAFHLPKITVDTTLL